MSRVLPILFNTDMVQAILDGRKTITRRIVKLPKHIKLQEDGLYTLFADGTCYENQNMEEVADYLKPPYQPGDILYVRETWQYAYELDGNEQIIEETGCYIYAADNPNQFNNWVMPDGTHRDCVHWKPSIHMPKEAARIWLKVTDVRVERLQDMTPYDAYKEGTLEHCIGMSACGGGCETCPADWDNGIMMFQKIWDSTIKKSDLDRYGWDANPWVWVIEFVRCEKPE